jgi:hypothetical protein
MTCFVFIDATNIIYGATKCGFKVDFKKLIAYLTERFSASRIYYYAGVDKENKKVVVLTGGGDFFGSWNISSGQMRQTLRTTLPLGIIPAICQNQLSISRTITARSVS